MARLVALPAAVLALSSVALGAEPQADPPSVAYVQATIADPNPSTGTLGFVSASGRVRVARVGGVARASLPNLRAGDEVILTLEGPAERPVITSMKVSRVVPAAPAAEPLAAAATVTAGPSRPSWPNPYSRLNPGLPFHPTRAARVAATPGGGTLSVMSTSLVAPAGSGTSQPVAVPAVLPAVTRTTVVSPATPSAGDNLSTVDALRARGAREFDAAVTRLAAQARSVDAVYARYQSACPASGAADEGSRAWLDLADGAALGGADPSCATLVEEIQHLAAPIKVGMMAAHEAARKAWVLPGTLRDIRRRHAMEWSGWDH
jgi:hypothetical protein